MEILKAKETDIDDIERIYEHIHDEEENGRAVIGWIRNVYPVRRTAEDALSRNDLFVMKEKNEFVAAAIINQIQVEEYKYARWRVEAEDSEVMVLHCLAVEPSKKNKGYGKKFVAFYEDYARRCGCSSLRMDTNARNTRARKLYQKLGYEETGIVKCTFNGIPDIQLVCLEKDLDAEEVKMKCPYCGKEMSEGQIHSFNSGMEWRTRGESMRLNTEKGLSKMIYGDRIDAYRCEHCKKIIISYE